MDDDARSLVRLYFEAGYSYNLILCFLASLHGIVVSLRTLKRTLHKMGLRRRGVQTDIARAILWQSVQDNIIKEIYGHMILYLYACSYILYMLKIST